MSAAKVLQPSRDCAIYIRVSTLDQGERYSPITQEKALRAKAERDGWRVRPEYVFVDKHSGKISSRPAFDEMHKLARSGRIGAVLVFNIDRFARKTADALRLATELKNFGVLLDFVETPFEDTPAGRFTFAQMSAVAEYIGEKIIEDSKRGVRQQLQQGKIPGGVPKYGYRYIDKRQPNGCRWEIHETRAAVVRDMFQWAREGMTCFSIAQRLNRAGILSAGYNGKPPGQWSDKVIYQILTSRVYLGYYERSGIRIKIDPIIDEKLWQAVQDCMPRTRARTVGRPPKEDTPQRQYLLRSFLWCAKCGHRCIRKASRSKPNGKGIIYYGCGHKDVRTQKQLCDAPGVVKERIEEIVWRSVWSVLRDPALLLRLGREYHDAVISPQQGRVKMLEKELTSLRARDERVAMMMEDGTIPYGEGRAKVTAIRARISAIAEELRRAGAVVDLPPLHAARAAVREIASGPEPTEYAERRNVLEGILDLHVTYYDGDLEIEGRVPVGAAASAGSAEKNRKGRIAAASNSFAPIPFRIKQRVA
jgi:DNA invertase Pin-like site-specific DNA recombinase